MNRLRVRFPLVNTKSESLFPLRSESALMADRKESAQEEARKANPVGVKVVQFRGLQPLYEAK